MDKGTHTGDFMIELQKTFDTPDHKVILDKMTCLGFKTPVIKWFESNLSNRKFLVSLDDVSSEAGIVNCGVSQ